MEAIKSSTVRDGLKHILWILIKGKLVGVIGVILQKVIERQFKKADQLHEVRQACIDGWMDRKEWTCSALVHPITRNPVSETKLESRRGPGSNWRVINWIQYGS